MNAVYKVWMDDGRCEAMTRGALVRLLAADTQGYIGKGYEPQHACVISQAVRLGRVVINVGEVLAAIEEAPL